MAGIGFELKKMIRKGSVLMSVGGYFYAAFASVGPLIISVVFLVLIRGVLARMLVPIQQQNMLLAGVTYSFIGGLTISGMLGMLMSRYVSDMLYTKQKQKIFASFLGGMAICIIIAGCVGLVFMYYIALPVAIEILCYVLMLTITAMFFSMVYISAVKNYVGITLNFIFGIAIGYFLIQFLIYDLAMETIYAVLIGMDVGFLLIVCFHTITIKRFFSTHDKSFFAFFSHIKKMPSLILINTFYMISIFAHTIIIWHTSIGFSVVENMRVAPTYDVPAFIALLTTTPAMVMFVVKTETTFYDHYKEYMWMLDGGGSLMDLEQAGKSLKDNMYSEIFLLMQVQLMVSVLSVILARIYFSALGLSDFAFTIFAYLCFGYYCIVMVNIISSIILYFDDRRSALKIMSVLMVTQIVFVLASIRFGRGYFGLGTLVSGIITLSYSLIVLAKMVDILDYRLYCTQPIGYISDETNKKKKKSARKEKAASQDAVKGNT
ncbi:MAG: exopolysaccharide Pel transporter PelG [Eubacteriales bacterium]